VKDQRLEIAYMTQFSDSSPGSYITCFGNNYDNVLNVQGFFGLTAGNQQSKNNDIDLKMIEFYNLNSNYYQNVYGIEKRDYFEFEKKKESAYKA
jgi:hypothetical protein